MSEESRTPEAKAGIIEEVGAEDKRAPAGDGQESVIKDGTTSVTGGAMDVRTMTYVAVSVALAAALNLVP